MNIDTSQFEDEDVRKILEYAIEADKLIKECQDRVKNTEVLQASNVEMLVGFKKYVDKMADDKVKFLPEADLAIKEKLKETSKSLENRLNEEAEKHSKNVEGLWGSYDKIKKGLRDKTEYLSLQKEIENEISILSKLAEIVDDKYLPKTEKGIQGGIQLRKRIKKETGPGRYFTPKKIMAAAAGIALVCMIGATKYYGNIEKDALKYIMLAEKNEVVEQIYLKEGVEHNLEGYDRFKVLPADYEKLQFVDVAWDNAGVDYAASGFMDAVMEGKNQIEDDRNVWFRVDELQKKGSKFTIDYCLLLERNNENSITNSGKKFEINVGSPKNIVRNYSE